MKPLPLVIVFVLIIALCMMPVSAESGKIKENKTRISVLSDSDIIWEDISPTSLKTESLKLPITKKCITNKTSKFYQVKHGAIVRVSEDTETIMQYTDRFAAIHYGYQKSINEPWENYCRFEGNRIVKADFKTRRVWIEPSTPQKMNDAINGDGIPEWEDL